MDTSEKRTFSSARWNQNGSAAMSRTTVRGVPWPSRTRLYLKPPSASSSGTIGLDKQRGTPRWHNPLKGLGTGLASIAAAIPSSGSDIPPIAQKQREAEQAND